MIWEGTYVGVPPLESFLERGAAKLRDTGAPFFTFTRPIRRSQPPTAPAGLETANEAP